jgi:PPOX class probable F420-dependent enzyme
VQLDTDACWERLGTAGHGVLGTVHARRGVDAVPVVFVVDDRRVVLPIDTVKPKSGHPLQRLRNLAADERGVLLVDHYDHDWARLWWVRVHGPAREAEVTPTQQRLLAASFPAYGRSGAVPSVIVLEPSVVTGWSAA